VTVAGSAITWNGTPTHSGNHTFSGTATVTGAFVANGAVTLGDAVGDTVTIGGVVHKNATGNWTIPAPSSGTTLSLSVFGSTVPLVINANAATNISAITRQGTTTGYLYDIWVNTGGSMYVAQEGSVGGTFVSGSTAYWGQLFASNGLQISTNNVIRQTINTAGNVTIAAPTSGTALTLGGIAGLSQAVSNSGSVNEWLLSNLSDTASSRSRLQLAVAGTSSGDANVYFLVSGASAWSVGVDTSDSQSFKISASSIPGTADKITITTGGNVTIAAPSSGVGLTQTGFAGSDTALFNGGTSGSFRVTDRGLPYGTSLHNNAGAVTGTTNQYICSGTYTPTVADVSNTTARAGVTSKWVRVGNIVTVTGTCTITATSSSSTFTQVSITLPIASNFVAGTDCNGVGVGIATSQRAGTIGANIAGDVAYYGFYATDASSVTHAFVFAYEML